MPLLGTLASGGFGKGGSAGGGGGGLYAFTDATFTSGGLTGATGPGLVQARSGLTGTGVDAWKSNTSYFNVTSVGIQLWVVPASGTYRIQATGARGGIGSGSAGNGAVMRGDFVLVQGDTLSVLVGQRGVDSEASGGGGGSFVALGSTFSSAILLIAAGGGGGYGSSGGNGVNAATSTSGTSGVGGAYAGGTSGNGGSTAYNSGWGGGGAGWLSAGGDGGVYGGIAPRVQTSGLGSTGPFNCSGVQGGFGGGGGGGCNGAGGGGGYSGGGTGGGGGGSYNNGTNQVNSAGSGIDGSVVITRL